MKQELFIDPCSKFIHSVFVAVSTAEKRTREIGNKNCSTVFPQTIIATKKPSYGRKCIKNVKALCNCLGALSVKLGTSCFCLFAFFSSLQSSLSALLAICNCTTRPLWQLPVWPLLQICRGPCTLCTEALLQGGSLWSSLWQSQSLPRLYTGQGKPCLFVDTQAPFTTCHSVPKLCAFDTMAELGFVVGCPRPVKAVS